MSVPQEAYRRLTKAFGPQRWWPALSTDRRGFQTEVMVGAVLVQNTAWTNVERAIANLHARALLDVDRLLKLTRDDLEELIRPAGPYRVKAQRLTNLLRLVSDRFGSVDAMFESPTDELRASLLSVSGVGPETADAILLYAGDRPRFVIDAYTRRVVGRHGWRDDLSYGGLQQWFEAELPADAAVFNEYHALMVEVGKRHCGPKPKCDGCPLRPMLP